MGGAKLSYQTIEEYLAQEEKSKFKSEYENGVIRAMSDGTLDHSLISANMVRQLGNKVDEKKLACNVFSSDARVYINTADSFVYPNLYIWGYELKLVLRSLSLR